MRQKRKDKAFDVRTITGQSGNTYVVFKTLDGGFHVFVETQAKEAGRDCGGTGRTTRAVWRSVWDSLEAESSRVL